MKDLSIIIVHFKQHEETKRLLDHLIEKTKLPCSAEILVVLNSSYQGNSISSNSIKFLKPGKNLGFGAGINYGWEYAKGENLLILNPDIIPEKNSIVDMLQFINSGLYKNIGILAPRLMYFDGSRQHSVRRFYRWFDLFFSRLSLLVKSNPYFYHQHLMSGIDISKPIEVDWAVGACLMLSRKFIASQPYIFDPRFFLYFEDVELCTRCWRSGFKVVYQPQIIFHHFHHRESKNIFSYSGFQHIFSGLKYFIKYRGLYHRGESCSTVTEAGTD